MYLKGTVVAAVEASFEQKKDLGIEGVQFQMLKAHTGRILMMKTFLGRTHLYS
jgi:hypothetical protein